MFFIAKKNILCIMFFYVEELCGENGIQLELVGGELRDSSRTGLYSCFTYAVQMLFIHIFNTECF